MSIVFVEGRKSRSAARPWVFMLLLSLQILCPGAPSAEDIGRPYYDLQLDKIKTLIDSYEGDGRVLEQAKNSLDKLLRGYARYPEVHIQMARYYMHRSTIDGRSYHGRMVAAAERETQEALRIDKNYAPAHLFLGHIYSFTGRYSLAETELETAKQLGSESPWLEIRYAELERRTGHADQTIDRLNKFIGSKPEPDVLTAAYQELGSAYSKIGDLDGTNRAYKKVTELEPDDAWAQGNYARFLLFYRGDFNGAIKYAAKALQIMPYGHAAYTLAGGFYAKWAHLRLAQQDPAEAEYYLNLARELYPDMGRMMAEMSRYPKMQVTVQAFRAVGVSEPLKRVQSPPASSPKGD